MKFLLNVLSNMMHIGQHSFYHKQDLMVFGNTVKASADPLS